MPHVPEPADGGVGGYPDAPTRRRDAASRRAGADPGVGRTRPAGRSTPTRRPRLPSRTSAAGARCGCSSDDREAGTIKTNRPTLRHRRALSAWMITLAATAASTYALDAAGDGGRRAARRVPAAERTRPPARARLPGRDVRAVGRRPAGEPRRQLGAPAVDRDQHQRALQGRLRAHQAAGAAHAASRGGRGLRRHRDRQGGALLRRRVRRRGADRLRLVQPTR